MSKPVAGTKFDPATHFEEGDLIYGINKARFAMTNRIIKFLSRADIPVLSADHLNNQFLGTGVSGGSKTYGLGGKISPTGKAEITTSPQHKLPAQEYQQWLEQRTKKDGSLIIDATAKTAVETEDDLYDAPQRFKRIKRSCKEGLAFATVEKKKRVHFNIDGIDMTKTVLKPPESDQWITAKELRSVFRRWNVRDIQDRVWFWKDVGGEPTAVDPPWVTDAVLWRKYKPKDTSAYRLMDPAAKPFVPASTLNPNAPVFVPGNTV